MKEGLGSGREGGVGSMVLRINKIYVSFFSVNLLITERQSVILGDMMGSLEGVVRKGMIVIYMYELMGG